MKKCFPAHGSGIAIGDTHESVDPKIREALLPDISTVERNPDPAATVVKRGTNLHEKKVSNPLKMWNDREAFMQVLIEAQRKADAAKP